jgi:hypothetical protein
VDQILKRNNQDQICNGVMLHFIISLIWEWSERKLKSWVVKNRSEDRRLSLTIE